MAQMPDYDGVLDRFAFHPATAVTGPIHDHIRKLFASVAAEVLNGVPAGRHQSLALTALQEAMMWCNAAVACDHPDREGEQRNPHSGPKAVPAVVKEGEHPCRCGKVILGAGETEWREPHGQMHSDTVCEPF